MSLISIILEFWRKIENRQLLFQMIDEHPIQQPADSPSRKDSLERAKSQIQVQKVSVTYEHFSKLRAILRPEQQPKFDSLLPRLSQVIAPTPPQNKFNPSERRN